MERVRPTRDAVMEGAAMADMPPRLKIDFGEDEVAGRALYGAYTGAGKWGDSGSNLRRNGERVPTPCRSVSGFLHFTASTAEALKIK